MNFFTRRAVSLVSASYMADANPDKPRSTMKILALVAVALALPAVVYAQQSPRASAEEDSTEPVVTCEAASLYATGENSSVSATRACRVAMEQCTARTPYGFTCNVTQWRTEER